MTAPYVSDRVERSIPLDDGRELELAIVIESGAEDVVRDHAESLGVRIDGRLPSGVLLVTVPRGSFDEFIGIPGIRSVSFQDEYALFV